MRPFTNQASGGKRRTMDAIDQVNRFASQSTHEPRKNHLSQLRRMTMNNREDLKMFDLNRQFILMSALQKSIRWCDVNDARYFAKELMDMDSKPATVFNQLLTIAAEDVGLADPSLIFYVRKLYGEFEFKRSQNDIKKADAFQFTGFA